MKIYDVICVGNYTKDTIITPDSICHVDGGGMKYAAYAGKRLGINAAIITRLAKTDEYVVKDIREAGIDCFPFYSTYSTLITLEYKTSNVDDRSLYVKHTAGEISPDHLNGVNAKAVAVSPSLRGEVQPEFFETLRKRDGIIIAMDVQGFVRVLRGENLVNERWDDMERVLPSIDILKSDAVEARYLTGEEDIDNAAAVFAKLGAKEIVLTHSKGVLIHADGQFHHYPFHSKSQEGRSGRGDTCLGSYVAKRLSLSPGEAGKWAAAVTSLKVEKPGPFDRSIAEVEAFIQCYYVENQTS